MARIDYNGPIAGLYAAGRGAPPGGLDSWREVLGEFLPVSRPLLDLGAGTGIYSKLIRDWFHQPVIAMDPSFNMLRQVPQGIRRIVGRAEAVPLRDANCGGAWLSTVIHHIDNLRDAARQLRRVLVEGAPVLIRSTFPGLQRKIALYRYFPSAGRFVDDFPSLDEVIAAFGSAGFAVESFRSVPQVNAQSVREFYEKVRHRANTTLVELGDDEFETGLDRLRRSAEMPGSAGAVVSELELLVLR